eukprot:2963904-Amphidinium_carterae.2
MPPFVQQITHLLNTMKSVIKSMASCLDCNVNTNKDRTLTACRSGGGRGAPDKTKLTRMSHKQLMNMGARRNQRISMLRADTRDECSKMRGSQASLSIRL